MNGHHVDNWITGFIIAIVIAGLIVLAITSRGNSQVQTMTGCKADYASEHYMHYRCDQGIQMRRLVE